MNHVRQIFIVLLFTVLTILSLPLTSQAQPPVTARVDRTTASTDDTLVLVVEISSATQNPSLPTLPVLDTFTVVGQSTASEINIVNGVMSVKTAYQYRLQPTQAGTLTIPSIQATVDGQSYSTEPITVEISQGTTAEPEIPTEAEAAETAPLEGQDFFVEAVVNNPEPYIGQQVSYQFRFYQALEVRGQIQYDGPDFSGFWSEREPDQSQIMTQAAARTYRMTELNTVLFPTVVGETVIGEARLRLPGQDLVAEAVSVNIRPLPDNPPAEFNGAVGHFMITAEINKRESSVDEPLNLMVTLNGEGNINNIPDPVWPEIPNWRVFESRATINTAAQEGKLGGSRVYELLLVPSQPGEFTLPAIDYSYFDPEGEAYLTVSSSPIVVTIAPGEAQAPVPVVIGSEREAVARLATDLRYIKSLPNPISSTPPWLTTQPTYWLAWGVPLVMLLFSLMNRRRQSYQQENEANLRSSKARKEARLRMRKARSKKLDPYAEGEAILTRYLSHKLNQPIAGLTQTGLIDLLQQQGVDESLSQQAAHTLQDCYMGRYGLSESDPKQSRDLLRRIDRLLDKLEKVLK